MVLSDLAIKRPVLATVFSLLIVVLGVASLLQLPVREFPDIDPPVVSITTHYTGASPEIIATEVTEIIEDRISSIDGVRNIVSQSSEGRSEITIDFETSRDIDAAANDVRDAVAGAARSLPNDADTPIISKADANARPMMWIALSSATMSPEELTDYATRQIVDRLSVVDGVARVRQGGQREYAMRIWLDRRALAARDLTVQEVQRALLRANIELPAGNLESEAREITVRTDSRLREPEEFAAIVVKRTDDTLVRLRDVARVERGVADDSTILRVGGRSAIGMGIIRQSQANTIAVAEAIRSEVDAIRNTLPDGVSITVSYDESIFVQESIAEVLKALAIAVSLVILVIFVFLRTIRATFIPAVTIPVAIIGAFTVMAALGFSINVLTLLALLLAIGLVVDDAIVVLENVQRRIEAGEKPLVASYLGTRQVAFAVIATTLTLVSVFVPISFLEGNVGRLFQEFGFVLAAAVIFSSLVALTLAPMLCSRWLRAPSERPPGRLYRATEQVFTALSKGYRWLLERALTIPVAVLGFALLLGASSYYLFQIVPEELTPTEDRGVFLIPLSAPQGSTAAYTDRYAAEIEGLVAPLLESGEANRVFSIVGFGGNRAGGFVIVGLSHWHERARSQQEIIGELFPKLMNVAGVRAFAINLNPIGQRGLREPIQFVLGGPDYETLKDWRDRILSRARENPRLLNLNADYEETRQQLDITIDRARAADLDITVEDIGITLQAMFADAEVSRYIDRGREYSVILQAERPDRTGPDDLMDIYVRSGSSGALVPLSSLITMRERGAAPRLQRVDRMPAITISGSLAPGYDLGSALAYLNNIAAEELPPEARISYLGESQELERTSADIYITFALALLIVFLVLAAQFESFVHPVIIMLSVPLAITGGLGALVLAGYSLNIYSQIGMILLIGLMAKNGILMVEFANQLRDQGYAVRDAILEGAALRFRPILMTTVSTIFGALPLVLAIGAGAESRSAIGAVIIGGLGFATLLTLFVIPVLYNLLARFASPANATAQELDRQLQENLAARGIHRKQDPKHAGEARSPAPGE